MLEEFRVDNFKSLINIVFKPHGRNLLTGLNNSGKTNLCHALQFISRSANHTLDQCTDLAGGRFALSNSALDKTTIDFYVRAVVPHYGELLTYEYELTISPPKTTPGESSVTLQREVLSVSGGGFDKTILLHNNAGNIRILHEPRYTEGTEEYIFTNGINDCDDVAAHLRSQCSFSVPSLQGLFDYVDILRSFPNVDEKYCPHARLAHYRHSWQQPHLRAVPSENQQGTRLPPTSGNHTED